jgi:hypothetical protein
VKVATLAITLHRTPNSGDQTFTVLYCFEVKEHAKKQGENGNLGEGRSVLHHGPPAPVNPPFFFCRTIKRICFLKFMHWTEVRSKWAFAKMSCHCDKTAYVNHARA